LKVRWILSFKAGKDRQAPTGSGGTDAMRGARYSLLNIFMPWGMSSTRQHPLFYLQFGMFHVGVATAIAMSVVMPYFPGLIARRYVVLGMQAIFGMSFLVGAGRMVRRIGSRYMRAISSPDDYFSLALLVVWLGFAFMAAPNDRAATEFWVLGFFLLTAFFLVYVPFSKISHYIFYPFTRWYLGKTMGHRGVYPMRAGREDFMRQFLRPNRFMEGKSR
jgi:nitrate reductase gamma subunit